LNTQHFCNHYYKKHLISWGVATFIALVLTPEGSMWLQDFLGETGTIEAYRSRYCTR